MIRTAGRTRRDSSAHNPIFLRLAALACIVAWLTGCGPRVAPDAPAGVSLAGSWSLNRQASADPDAMINAIVAKELKHMRRRARMNDEDDPDPPPPPGGGGRAENVEPPGGMFRPREGMSAYLRSRYTNALASILNGDGLIVEQDTDRFALVRNGSRRSFTPGGHSVVGVTDGVADQSSGWNGREYVIDVRPQVGPRVTERYSLSPNGQLIEKVSLSGDELPKLEFTRVYDKGTPPARVLPGS